MLALATACPRHQVDYPGQIIEHWLHHEAHEERVNEIIAVIIDRRASYQPSHAGNPWPTRYVSDYLTHSDVLLDHTFRCFVHYGHGLRIYDGYLGLVLKGFYFNNPYILRYNHHRVDDERDLDSGALRK